MAAVNERALSHIFVEKEAASSQIVLARPACRPTGGVRMPVARPQPSSLP